MQIIIVMQRAPMFTFQLQQGFPLPYRHSPNIKGDSTFNENEGTRATFAYAVAPNVSKKLYAIEIWKFDHITSFSKFASAVYQNK